MTRRTIIIAAAIALSAVIALATGGFGLIGNRHQGELTLYGNVDVRDVEMAFRTSGRVASVAVQEGDKVMPGEVLASLDPAPAQDRLGEAEANLAQARANLAELRAGNRPQAIVQARAQHDAAVAQLADAKASYDRRQPLVQAGAISQSQWDATTAAYRAAQAAEEQARAALSLQQAGARSQDIQAAEARLKAAEAARDSARTALDDTRLKAATPGTVMTRAIEPGSMVQAGQTALAISIDRPLRVRAYVDEPDLSRIAPGMKVEVRADGNPKTYHGSIGYISPQAEFTPRSVETASLRTDLVYRLRVIVSDPDDGLRQGQPVTVTVTDAHPASR